MRWVLLVVALSGCGRAKSTGPAWPAPSTTAEDGGESIEPRDKTVATSLEKSVDKADDEAKPPVAEPTAKPAEPAATAKPEVPVPQPAQPADDDPIISDEIIIEIED